MKLSRAEVSAWAFITKQFPSAHAAWKRDVRLPIDEFIRGESGKPRTPKAIDRGCYDSAYTGCRCHEFVDGRWVPYRRAVGK